VASATQLDLVTGAFSYSGSHIARRLLDEGRQVRTLSFHPERAHSLQGRVQARPYRFEDPAALARDLEGVSTLYNTFWVRFDHAQTSFEQAVERSRALFGAARRAGVQRIVHVSITNPSLDSPLPYFRGKALVERALMESGVPCSIVRPTLIFGGEHDVLINNIAWILRRMPIFAVPGDGAYRVQPVHVEDLARICADAALAEDNLVVDAAGPETVTFRELVSIVRRSTGAHALLVNVPARAMGLAARALGLLMRDVVLTDDEIDGLMAGLLVSHEPPRGTIALSSWLADGGASVGDRYANELRRHFASRRA
jgi:uncharacterized protein YbjT (DUF2867 family)